MGVVRMVRPWDEWLLIWGYDIDGPPPEMDDAKAREIAHNLIGDHDIPIPLNQRVLAYIELFQGRLHDFIEDGKGFLGEPRADRPLPHWLSEADLAHFTAAYQKSSFRGGLNWYRNIDRNWDLTAPWQDAQIHQPSLFIAGSKDSVITARTPSRLVPLAAQSRDDPEPYSLPPSTTSGIPWAA